MRLVVASLALGLAAGLTVAPAAAAQPDRVQPTWTPCPDLALECATVKVPLDYRRPGGTTIDDAQQDAGMSLKRHAKVAMRWQ